MLKIEKMDDFAKNRKYPPTANQWQAISIAGADVLVAAAAGSGKTEVLSERIARKVALDRWDIDRLLVLTFTTAAAKNMLVRIENKISERLLATNLPEDRTFLRKQQVLMNDANVSTIDSFCLNVLRKFYYLVEEEIDGKTKYLSPNFSILPNSRNLLFAAIEEVLEAYYKIDKQALDLLFTIFGEKKNITSSLSNIYYKLLTIPNFESYLKEDFLKSNKELLRIFDFESFEKVDEFREVSFLTTKEELKKAYNFALFVKGFLKYTSAESLMENLFARSGLDEERRGKLEKFFVDEQSGLFSSSLEKVEELDELISILDFELEKENNVFDAARLSDIYLQLSTYYEVLNFAKILEGFGEIYRQILLDIHASFIKKKRENNFLDFSDLNHLAIKALEDEREGKKVPTVAAEYYREHFLEIYVDEYQDNNNLQEYILNIIRGEGVSFFRVGDVKQAIYGFRGSNPDLFEEKYNSYKKLEIPNYDVAKDYELPFDSSGVCIMLKENFRSYRNVLSSSNFIFNQLMENKNAGVSYDKESALYYPATKIATEKTLSKEEKSKLILPTKLISGELDYFTNEPTEKDLRLQSIENIAYEILLGVSKGEQYSDYAILVRNSKKMKDYKDILKKYNIPLFFKEKIGFTASNCFNLLYNLFRFLDNNTRDASLVVILHSEIFDYSNDELLRLSLENGETLFEKLVASTKEKDKTTTNLLNKWLNFSLNNSISSLLEKVVSDIDFVNYLITIDVSDEEVDYYENFVDVVKEYEVLDNKLGGFVNYLKNIKSEGEFETKKRTPANSVTLSTIHISKGLEYKYVFVADLDTEFSKKGYEADVLFTEGFGFSVNTEKLAAKFGLGDAALTYFNKLNRLNATFIKSREREEEVRNLYVALTRAEKVLYLVSPNGIKLNSEEEMNKKVSTAILEEKSFEKILNIVLSEYDFENEEAKFEFYEPSEKTEELVEEEGNFSLENFYEKISEKNKNIEISSVEKKVSKNKIFPAKTSYSALKKINRDKIDKIKENKNKAYLELSTLTKTTSTTKALLRGNVVHKLFERIVQDSAKGVEISNLKFYIENLVKTTSLLENIKDDRLLTEEEYKLINNSDDFEKIKAFVESSLISLVKENKIQTEVAFTTKKEADELYTKSHSKADVILQGVVDLLVDVSENEMIIVDYKTDNVRGKMAEETLKQRHHEQLRIYKEAVVDYYKKENIKTYIYSYTLMKLIEVEV